MSLSTRPPLYILAFDHRVSLIKMFGENGGQFNGRKVDFSDLKSVIFDGLVESLPGLGLRPQDVGILIDEECGAAIARKAKAAGVKLAMPAERSMQNVFELEYGADRLELHEGAVTAGHCVVLVDDLLATGGTILAAARLMQSVGAEVAAALFVIDLPDLGGSQRLEAAGLTCETLIAFDGD